MKSIFRVGRFGRGVLVAAAASAVAVPAFADGVDTSSLVTLLATGLVAVAAIGTAVLGVQGLIKLYGMVKGALART